MYQRIAANKRRSLLLIGAVVSIVVLIGYIFGSINDNTPGVLTLAGLFAIASTATSWFAGDRIALMASGAKALPREADLELHRLIENLAITAGIPTPKVYLIPDASMNAFATGRDPRHASVAVTVGLRNALDRTELEGVIAHELSHIKNYDTRYLMLAITLVGFIAIASDFFLRAQLFGGRGRSERNVPPLLLFVGIALAILSPLIAKLLQFAISRRREFLADADGVLLTRYPNGLKNALLKISAANIPTQSAATATAPLYIVNPFAGSRRLSGLFSTHPPIKERIAALETFVLPA